MTIDDRGIGELLEESQDLHSDAMTTTRTALDDLVHAHHDARREGTVLVAADDARRSLNSLLGQHPVPDSFAKQDGARTSD